MRVGSRPLQWIVRLCQRRWSRCCIRESMHGRLQRHFFELIDTGDLSLPILQPNPEAKLKLPRMSAVLRLKSQSMLIVCPTLTSHMKTHSSTWDRTEVRTSSQVGSCPRAVIPMTRSFWYLERLVKYDTVFILFGGTCQKTSSSWCCMKMQYDSMKRRGKIELRISTRRKDMSLPRTRTRQ